MEVYLVKNEVKIIPVSEAFSKSRVNFSGVGASSDSQDEDDRTLLTVSDLPVVLTSICSGADVSQHSEQFAERVESRLLDREDKKDIFQNIKLELVINDKVDKDANSLNGYFVLSSISPEGSIKLNIINRLYRDLGHAELELMIEVSLCRLPIVDAPVSPESLISLKGEQKVCSFFSRGGRTGMRGSVGIPLEVKEWWEQGTGLIYSKSSVKVFLSEKAVNWAYDCSTVNEGLLGYNPFTDLEIECKSGEIIDCHRAILAEKSGVLWHKLEEMAERKKVGPWKMMEMSEVAVKEFLEYIYCDKVSGGVWGCDVALELFKAGRHYEVAGLPMAMEEMIMAKESSDLEYFSRQSAQDLFVYARKNGKDMKHLMDKATRVLHNFPETTTDEKVGSKEYQDLFEDEPLVNSFPWQQVWREMLPILMVVLYAVAVAKRRGGGASGN